MKMPVSSIQKRQSNQIGVHDSLKGYKSESVVRYTLPENETQIFASKYKLYLPSEEELLRELQGGYEALEYDKKKENQHFFMTKSNSGWKIIM